MNLKDNLSTLMKKAQEMQTKMQSAQKELENMTVIGEAGGGLVKVEMTGRHDVKRVTIDPSVIDQDQKELLEDLIASAVNDAVKKVEKETRSRMAGLTAGLDLPKDLQGPFGEE